MNKDRRPQSPAPFPLGREKGAQARHGPQSCRQEHKRGVALIMVLASITILTVLLTEFQDEASSEAAAALADRDALKAEYVAKSAVNLARLLIASEPTIRTAVGPMLSLMTGGNGAPQIPVWDYSDRILGAFNDQEGTQSFASLAGVDLTSGKNLGLKGARFEVMIVDEDSKININLAARGDAITEQRLGLQLLGLMQGEQYNPLFENRDGDGQFSDRQATCSALVDWADPDEVLYACDPRTAQNTGQATEDAYYQLLKAPYRRKNAPYDSLEELHLVRGVSDDFFTTFIDPDPENPRKRTLTVWGQGTVNVNSANAQTLLAIVCGAAVPNTPLCTDPLLAAKFLTAVNLLRGFTAGVPLFPTPPAFVKAMQGQGMFGKVLKDMLGLEPIQFISVSETQKMISTQSKVFSIYADGIVPGYRKKTRVRIHTVVDFRNAPPPGAPPNSPSGATSSTAATPATTSNVVGNSGVVGANGSSASSAADSLAAALAPNAGGAIIYYRIE